MTSQTMSETFLRPREEIPLTTRGGTRGLSPEILGRSARRLRILALMYAFTFFMASFLPALVSEMGRAELAANAAYMVPDVLSILVGLAVAAATLNRSLPLHLVLNLGLAFLIVSNYGIAIAEYVNPARLNNNGWIGLSWVAVWTPLYTVVVPTRPRTALLVTLASVASVRW
jgi:hypothetical protein